MKTLKDIFFLFGIGIFILWIPSTQGKTSQLKPEVIKILKTFDCPLLLGTFHPKYSNVSQLGYCFQTKTVEQGIFVAHACVVKLIEPLTKKIRAYREKSDWGIEGKCDGKLIEKILTDPSFDRTQSPLTDIQIKRKEGQDIQILRDDWNLGPILEKVTHP